MKKHVTYRDCTGADRSADTNDLYSIAVDVAASLAALDCSWTFNPPAIDVGHGGDIPQYVWNETVDRLRIDDVLDRLRQYLKPIDSVSGLDYRYERARVCDVLAGDGIKSVRWYGPESLVW